MITAKVWGRGVLVLVVALWFWTGCEGAPFRSGPKEKTSGLTGAVEVNAKAPAFAAPTLKGGTVRLSDYIGSHVVLLEFWSVFCRSCIEEMPRVEELYLKYRSQGLSVLSINTDVFSPAKVASTLEKAGVEPSYPVLRDPRQEIVDAYRVELLPVTAIIDRDGWIRLYQEGYRSGDEKIFEDKIRSLLVRTGGQDVTLGPHGGVTAFAPAGAPMTAVGQKVSGLSARSLDGQSVSLEQERPRLFFFWSLYCNPCRAGLPQVARLARRYSDRGLVAYALNVDSVHLLGRVVKHASLYSGMPCVLDLDGQGNATVSRLAGIRATPALILLDSEGTIVYSESGSTNTELLEDKIRQLVGGE